ncbi:MAG: hypothetical protein JST26_20040 [Bacteroidetes bacterium]|nr:hypothetical protein [Bacteroidota bacterium]
MTIETSTAHVSLIDDVVAVISVKENVEIDVPQTWENYHAVIKLNPAGDFPVLFETRGFVSISKESRELVASKEMAKESCATALLVENMAMKIFGNFFIRFDRPPRPTKLFTDRAEAIAWCKEQYRLIKR